MTVTAGGAMGTAAAMVGTAAAMVEATVVAAVAVDEVAAADWAVRCAVPLALLAGPLAGAGPAGTLLGAAQGVGVVVVVAGVGAEVGAAEDCPLQSVSRLLHWGGGGHGRAARCSAAYRLRASLSARGWVAQPVLPCGLPPPR